MAIDWGQGVLHFPFAFISWPFASLVIGVPRSPIHNVTHDLCVTISLGNGSTASQPRGHKLPICLLHWAHSATTLTLVICSDPSLSHLRVSSSSSILLRYWCLPWSWRESEVERPPPTPSLAQSDQRERLAGSCDSAWCLVVPDKQIMQEFPWERQVSFRRGKWGRWEMNLMKSDLEKELGGGWAELLEVGIK